MSNKGKRTDNIPHWGEDLIKKLDDFLYEKPTRNIMKTIDQFFENAKGPDRIPVDILETETEWIVNIDLPGIRKEQIKLAVHGNQLTVLISSKEETEQYDQTYEYYRKERREQNKERTISLPYPIDREKVKVKFENGLLQIRGPRSQQDKDFMSID
ncbi:Hsp20/alpha crystallin family protein [Gracilibacillus oryzae]|uniref:Hsp20/alpha crystallin family protein n=1 Tax=Gracilibacillus oryzae TaxID=1672701 RepID=A0A7C8GQY9_9BACI|nr:Hsp20/alpha crystallin family protein [Gracilibacillus oryzae]KAB8125786.1 Hsp20/alpha crystallin family protein [Gracilibacillus oryzae]